VIARVVAGSPAGRRTERRRDAFGAEPYPIGRGAFARSVHIADNDAMLVAPIQPIDALLRSRGIEAVCPWLSEMRALMPRAPAALS